MRSFILIIATLFPISSAAIAQDGFGYVGIEGGASLARHIGYDVAATRVQSVPTGNGLLGQTVTTTSAQYGRGFVADQKAGVDVDAIAGYDFGVFRLEGEIGYKRAKLRHLTASSFLLNDTNTAPIGGVTPDSFGSGRHTSVLSGMINGLVSYDVMPKLNVYGGGGVGRARVTSLGDHDDKWAYQLIAGASTPIKPNLEIGVKYRYFQTDRLNFSGAASFSDAATGATSVSQFSDRGKFRSNSLLLSIVYSFRSAR